jgi:hypothetical protein
MFAALSETEAAAVESYRATQPAGKDRVMSLLKQAAYSKNIEPETVEGALVYLESITAAGAQPQAHDTFCIGSCHHQPHAQQACTSTCARNATLCTVLLHCARALASTGACSYFSPHHSNEAPEQHVSMHKAQLQVPLTSTTYTEQPTTAAQPPSPA